MCKSNAAMRRSMSVETALVNKMLKTSELLGLGGAAEEKGNSSESAKRRDDYVAGFVPRLCMQLGVCVCQGPKRQDILHFWNNVSCIFRQVFWRRKKLRSESRKLLDEQSIFVEFSMVDSVSDKQQLCDDDDGNGWGDFYRGELEQHLNLDHVDDASLTSERSYYFHIGHINLSTYHFSLWEMKMLDYQQSDVKDDKFKVKVLALPAWDDIDKQAGVFTDIEAFARLDLRFAWKMSFHTFFWGDAALSLRADCALAVAPAPSPCEFVVWQGSAKEAQRRKLVQKKKNSGQSRSSGQQKRRKQGQEQHKKGTKKRKTERQGQAHDPAALEDPEEVGQPGQDSPLADGNGMPLADSNVIINRFLEDQDQSLLQCPFEVQSDDDQPGAEHANDNDKDKASSADEISLSDMDSPEEGENSDTEVNTRMKKQKQGEKQKPALEKAEDDLLDLFADNPGEPVDIDAPPAPPEGVERKPVERTTYTRSTANRDVFEVPGLGSLRYYYLTGSMTASCKHHDDDCRKSATCDPVSKKGSGRPIGHLVAWLQRCEEFESRREHVHTCRPTLEQRQSARSWFESLPGSSEFTQWEKKKQVESDPNEPLKV